MMAYVNYSFRYTTGRAANVVGLIFARDFSTLRTSGTTLSAVSGVADSGFAAGRLAATERVTSNATGTGLYYLATFPALAAGWYILQLYDVATPANASPSPSDTPISGNGTNLVFWDGIELWEGSIAVALGQSAIDQIGGVALPAAGSDQCTLTITDDDSDDPIADADVWISTDADGAVIVAGTKQTNDDGEVLFLLDAGLEYFLWMQKAGTNPINGRSFTAVAD